MTKLVIDSAAWVEYLQGSLRAEKLKKYFENSELFTTSITVAEVVAKALKKGLSEEIVVDAIQSMSTILPVDFALGAEAGKVYAELRKTRPKIALADAFTLCAARKISAKVVTFDNDFHGLSDAIVIN